MKKIFFCLLVAVVPTMATAANIEKFIARWLEDGQSFEVIAVCNIPSDDQGDFIFTWSANGKPLQAVCHYGGQVSLPDGELIPGRDKWVYRQTHNNPLGFRALEMSALLWDGAQYSENSFFLAPPMEEREKIIQNHPNPFNPSTTIRYSLPRPSKVKLEIFNISGQRVAELVDAHQPRGEHKVKFSAAHLPSGTYFCRIQAGDWIQTKKILHLK